MSTPLLHRPARPARWSLALLLPLLAALPAHAQDLANFSVFQTGFTRPGFLASPPGEPERILIGQLSGVIRVVENGILLPTPFLDIHTRLTQNHGLIGVAFPPDYATSRRFYVNYTPASGSQPRIARYTTSSDPNIANTTEEILLHTGTGGGDHNSGWMDFGRDGDLYIARGDAGGNPQSINAPQGKLLRIDVSPATGYSVPPDNPFVGIDGLDEVVALGLRNPWRNGFDRLTGDLYIADVGAGSNEEIDYIPFGTIVGRNFGWPCLEGLQCHSSTPPCSCTSSAMTQPIHSYTHSLGTCIIGGTVYRGSAIPRWRGRYFFMDNGSGRVWSLIVVNGAAADVREHQAELNEGLPASQRLRSGIAFGTDAAGELYALEVGGRILKIVPEFAPADWNLDSLTNSADFFDFLVDFFEDHADLTGDHVTSSDDFFEYLSFFFGT